MSCWVRDIASVFCIISVCFSTARCTARESSSRLRICFWYFSICFFAASKRSSLLLAPGAPDGRGPRLPAPGVCAGEGPPYAGGGGGGVIDGGAGGRAEGEGLAAGGDSENEGDAADDGDADADGEAAGGGGSAGDCA